MVDQFVGGKGIDAQFTRGCSLAFRLCRAQRRWVWRWSIVRCALLSNTLKRWKAQHSRKSLWGC